jgi:hypothetical protein
MSDLCITVWAVSPHVQGVALVKPWAGMKRAARKHWDFNLTRMPSQFSNEEGMVEKRFWLQ